MNLSYDLWYGWEHKVAHMYRQSVYHALSSSAEFDNLVNRDKL